MPAIEEVARLYDLHAAICKAFANPSRISAHLKIPDNGPAAGMHATAQSAILCHSEASFG